MECTDIADPEWALPRLEEVRPYNAAHVRKVRNYTFFYAVADAMRSQAHNQNGRIRYGRLARYIYRRALREGIILGD